MGLSHSPKIVTNGLVMCLDAGNIKSYPGSGTTWTDLSGRGNHGTLTNGPAFSSLYGGGLVFDGANDYSRPSINHSHLSSSSLEIIFRSANHGSENRTLFGYRHNSGYSIPTLGSLYLNSSILNASLITASQVYRVATFPTTIQTNQTYHAILNKNTITGTMQIFVNGVAGDVQTFDAATYAQWTSAGSFIGVDVLDIAKSTNDVAGQGWGTDYFNGSIYKLAIYSRVLTATEIQQNFNALRGRYGI